MKILILSFFLLNVSLSALAQNSGIKNTTPEKTDTTAVQLAPVMESNAVPIVTEKSTTPVPSEVQLTEPKSNAAIKEED